MQLVVISGLSGSGKSVALNVLEDAGFYCMDNLPLALLGEAVRLLRHGGAQRLAAAIDVRSGAALASLPEHVERLRAEGVDVRLVFLDARDDTLLRRFSETRRRHPLARGSTTIEECIASERELLAPVAEVARRIDTSGLHPNALRAWIRELVALDSDVSAGAMTLVVESFGFKQGIPLDADYVFDVRVLPNPHYDPALRALDGRDPAVAAYLEHDQAVLRMLTDIREFIERWLPAFALDNRSALTVALGCTGGQHRSVFLVERLAAHFRITMPVLVRHRQLAG